MLFQLTVFFVAACAFGMFPIAQNKLTSIVGAAAVSVATVQNSNQLRHDQQRTDADDCAHHHAAQVQLQRTVNAHAGTGIRIALITKVFALSALRRTTDIRHFPSRIYRCILP